jgi:hypothetical protein
LFCVVSFVNPFSFNLLSHFGSTEEVIAYAYKFPCIPCSFLH